MALVLGSKRACAPQLLSSKRARGFDGTLPAAPGPLDLLPFELLEKIVCSCTGTAELCSLARVCWKLRTLAESEALWQTLYSERWCISPLTRSAATLAGSWKKLFASRLETDRVNAPNEKPCPFEKEAAIAQLARCKGGPAAGGLTLLFLVDGSGSVSTEDFQEMKAFMSEAAAETASSCQTELQVGILQFSSQVKVELGPSTFQAPDFSAAVEKMVPINGGTDYAIAIARASLLLRTAEPSSHVSMVLLTDGRVDPYQGREAADAVRALQEACSCSIALYAFGIGRSIDESELRKIVDVCQPGSADSCYLTLYGKDDGYPFEGL